MRRWPTLLVLIFCITLVSLMRKLNGSVSPRTTNIPTPTAPRVSPAVAATWMTRPPSYPVPSSQSILALAPYSCKRNGTLNWVQQPLDTIALQSIENRTQSLLSKLMSADGSTAPRQFDHIKKEALSAKRMYMESLWTLPQGSPPDISRLRSILNSSSDVLYVILTGKNSHRDRIDGLHYTLGQVRNVIWFSDEHESRVQPHVLSSDFEDQVCAQNLAEETQLKGCRYQRNFYRGVQMWHVIGKWLRDAPAKPAQPWRRFKWIVRLSDDTLVLPWILEELLLKLPLAEKIGYVLGKNESRSQYWFFSGGHPIVFSMKAAVDFSQAVDTCEGIVLDHGPEALKKFWWWADDVLLSFCLSHLSTSLNLSLQELPGCISSPTFRKASLPLPCLDGTKPPHRIAVHFQQARFHQEGKRGKGATVSRNISAIPVSYHSYPFITPSQMFSVWNCILFLNCCFG